MHFAVSLMLLIHALWPFSLRPTKSTLLRRAVWESYFIYLPLSPRLTGVAIATPAGKRLSRLSRSGRTAVLRLIVAASAGSARAGALSIQQVTDVWAIVCQKLSIRARTTGAPDEAFIRGPAAALSSQNITTPSPFN